MACTSCSAAVKTGADILVERRLDLVKGKQVGLITNHTGRLSTGEFLVDALRARGVHVVALFAPEHGIRGQAQAGASVQNETDSATGIPVYSLYGATTRIQQSMLKGIDLLIYDIQGLPVRFYTYLSTMGLSMEAAAEAGIPFIVLDRPDPLGGQIVDGPIMQDSLKSFVGMYPLPVVYGLTCGELAQMINRERWLSNGVQANLTVVPVEGWTRGMSWGETGLTWYPPSPNIPTAATAFVYPATCFIEGTNLSEGRGTSQAVRSVRRAVPRRACHGGRAGLSGACWCSIRSHNIHPDNLQARRTALSGCIGRNNRPAVIQSGRNRAAYCKLACPALPPGVCL